MTDAELAEIRAAIRDAVREAWEQYAPPRREPFITVRDLVAEGVDTQHAADWLRTRKAKNLPLTQTAWDRVKSEAVKAKMTPAQAVEMSAQQGWAGFKHAWPATLQPKAPEGPTVAAVQTQEWLRQQDRTPEEIETQRAKAAEVRAMMQGTLRRVV